MRITLAVIGASSSITFDSTHFIFFYPLIRRKALKHRPCQRRKFLPFPCRRRSFPRKTSNNCQTRSLFAGQHLASGKFVPVGKNPELKPNCALDSGEKVLLTGPMLRTLALILCLSVIPRPGGLRAAVVTPEGYTRAEFLSTNEIRVPFTPAAEIQKWLDARSSEQARATARLGAFHNFRFEDRTAQSGITFKHNVVDDAGKTFKAAHYDHGTGLAVADVDGDGLLDIYFVNQKGGTNCGVTWEEEDSRTSPKRPA